MHSSVGRKRNRLSPEGKDLSVNSCSGSTGEGPPEKKTKWLSPHVIDYSDPCAVRNMVDELDYGGRYGSVTKEINELIALKMRMLHPYFVMYPELVKTFGDKAESVNQHSPKEIITLDDDDLDDDTTSALQPSSALRPSPALLPSPALRPSPVLGPAPVVVIDLDDEDAGEKKLNFQEIVLPVTTPVVPFCEPLIPLKAGHITTGIKVVKHAESATKRKEKANILAAELEVIKEKHKGVYVGVEDADDESQSEDDDLGDIWNDMSMALECSKGASEDPLPDEQEKDEQDCEHSFVLKDDLGFVCRVCGVVDREIESIIEIQYLKKRSTRTYASESRNGKDRNSADIERVKLSGEDLMVTDITAHPRHTKQMKPHQIEGFNFLRSNLLADNPGGCILAHAPGSGKTFMIISFMQAFLAKYPQAKPLVVLPKGILATWKKEFQTWQIEDIPLLDFYTVKADNRAQQLAVLKQWVEQKSMLFLGYKQFSTIVCDNANNQVATVCQEILLKAPSILILDEGHTPRNENTDVLQSLAKVQTPRKVVLSGTLYQNHVKEVFNILNLVRPKFLKLDTSRAVQKRIMSRVQIGGVRKNIKPQASDAFYDLVEHTLHKDEDFKRKVTVIQDLREMTSKVLHYYKGDFLDELPGLVDFTVVLNLSSKQKKEVMKLKKLERKFKVAAVGSAIYMHPRLHSLTDTVLSSESLVHADRRVDELLEKLDVRDGVKAKFFLNLLNLCESSSEKLLVFSQYLLPLKFLERLTAKTKGWCSGREMFMISGECSSDQRERAMESFNNSSQARVFFGSIKACGEGISLVGASRIIILDVHLNPSVTRQAIGRAFRPGQKKKVYTYRLIASDSPEEEDHSTCFKKELISKMWFEWNEYCGYKAFQVEAVDLETCGDCFLESPLLKEDVKALFKR